MNISLSSRLTEIVNEAYASGEMQEKVSTITADLMRFWFDEPFTSERSINFHEGQRQAVLNVIYLHEVLKINNVTEIYASVAKDHLPSTDLQNLAKPKYSYPKYAVKMATGTGKTWVMHALMIWQILNAKNNLNSDRYTQNFLLVAPGLVVYDRLLDAFKGRLVSGESSERDSKTSDFHKFQDLFIPPAYRDEVFGFLQNNVVSKEDGIGRKVTGNGLIAITNWHLFMSYNDESKIDPESAPAIISDLLPARPGTSTGNSLDTLDNAFLRGNELEYLASLSDLMIMNDEAHHIHENKVAGEIEDVEWQKGIDFIANNKEKFFQLDFSATPYSTSGSGKNQIKHYFPHIVVDFDLSTAMRKGLVKTLLLDKRQELTELEHLDYKAIRDERNKVIGLSEGQRLMLRAGLTKLSILEKGFSELDSSKKPKMMIMCEDTSVTPFVSEFLIEEGIDKDDVLTIDSNKQGEVNSSEWAQLKEKLFNIDNYEKPKIIVSVLMLREGFDVKNICVIVPLRAAGASILLEQTIGRGLRLMWREPEYQDEKAENRKAVFVRKERPKSYLDMLSIIEHPAFEKFYNEFLKEGLAGIEIDDLEISNTIGDMIKIGLKENYQDYDLIWPVIIRDAEEEIAHTEIFLSDLEPFALFSLDQLRSFLVSEGETFYSEAILSSTTFGKYEVKADLFTANSYNEYLQKMLRTITSRVNRIGGKALPSLQINEMELVKTVDLYIRTRLFETVFNPFNNNDWKILLSKNAIVTQHIIKVMSIAIHNMQENIYSKSAEVEQIKFSSVPVLRMREKYSIELQKVIYERINFPTNKGNLEKEFMMFLDNDGEVERFIKINETKHDFTKIFYIREDGLLATYHPDFLVCTDESICIVETKGNDKIHDINVKRKQLAIVEWCRKINKLQSEFRMNREWKYILLKEENFYTWSQNGASFKDIENLSQVSSSQITGNLFE